MMKNLNPSGGEPYTKDLTDRQYIEIQSQNLKMCRTPFEAFWRDIADNLLPYRLRLNLTDYNRGDRRNLRSYDSTPMFGLETLENGWLSAASDQATEWFSLTHKDAARAEFGPHKQWYDDVTSILLGMMAESNGYITLGTFYGNNAGFGTGCMSVEESTKGAAIHTDVINTGGYWIGQDEESNINTFYEEVRLTVRQCYEQFGGTADFSSYMRNMVDKGRWDQWVDVGHMIQPNLYYNPGISFSGSKPWASWWFEVGSTGSNGQYGYTDAVIKENIFLRRAGYDTFPIITARYEMMRGETWGFDCPGMKILGDTKTLQNYEKRLGQMMDKIVNPHWIAPSSLVGQADHGFIPGETTYLPSAAEEAALRPAHMVPPNAIAPANEKESEIRQRIGKGLSTDLFQLFDSLPDKERTATEIMQRKSEKLSKLGKPYANLQEYTFRPLINRLFYIAVKRGMIPPAPPDIQGHEISYQYNGILAQAQKMARFQPQSTLLQVANEAASETGGPQSPVWQVVNLDNLITRMGEALQLQSDVINPPEVIAQMRQQAAQQAAQQQKLAMLESASKSAKNLAQSPTGEDSNALADIVGSVKGS